MKTLAYASTDNKIYVKKEELENALAEGFKFLFVGWNSVSVYTEEEHDSFLKRAWNDRIEDIKEEEDEEDWKDLMSDAKKSEYLEQYDDYGVIADYLEFPVDDEETGEYIFDCMH